MHCFFCLCQIAVIVFKRSIGYWIVNVQYFDAGVLKVSAKHNVFIAIADDAFVVRRVLQYGATEQDISCAERLIGVLLANCYRVKAFCVFLITKAQVFTVKFLGVFATIHYNATAYRTAAICASMDISTDEIRVGRAQSSVNHKTPLVSALT